MSKPRARTRRRGVSTGLTRLTYSSWNSMVQRCTNPNVKCYPRYGGVGVRICEGLRDAVSFIAIMGLKKPGDTIDRFPISKGNYTCGDCSECQCEGWQRNVRWATKRQQSRNRSANLVLTAFGRTQCLADWAEELGLKTRTLWARIHRGMPAEEALRSDFIVPKSFGDQNGMRKLKIQRERRGEP